MRRPDATRKPEDAAKTLPPARTGQRPARPAAPPGDSPRGPLGPDGAVPRAGRAAGGAGLGPAPGAGGRRRPIRQSAAAARRGQSGQSSAPWVLAAHMDHPGFISIDQRGRTVRAAFHGGVDLRYFPGRMVWHTPAGPIRGAVTSARKAPGGRSYDVRIRLDRLADVPAGSLGMWDSPAFRVGRNSRRLASRACDDLVGLAMSMCAMEEACRASFPTRQRAAKDAGAADLYLLATRGEEAGFVGAMGPCGPAWCPRAPRWSPSRPPAPPPTGRSAWAAGSSSAWATA